MRIEDAFLYDILTHPDDDAPRLIYADWLDEHNDPRGEFIRVQCSLAQLSDEDPRRWPLEQREQDLLREHGAKWLPKNRGRIPCIFRRGFVEEMTLSPEEFLASARPFFEQTPLRSVCLRQHEPSLAGPDGPDSPMARVAQSPLLARLDGLSLNLPLNRYAGQALMNSPHLEGLTQLRLSGDFDGNPLVVWGPPSRRPRLRHLDLSNCTRISFASLRTLVEMPNLAGLRHLNLAHTSLTPDDLRFLLQSSSLTNLVELDLSGNHLTHRAVSVLAEGRLLAQLETLRLHSNLLGDTGALSVREWPALPRLTRLSLGYNHIFADGVQSLAEAPALRDLISLDLFGNIACDRGAAALAAAGWARLQALNLRFNGVGDEGVRALAHSKGLSQLTQLNLTANCITGVGARALVESPYLTRSARLDLQRNDIAEAEQQRLRDRFGPFVSC